MIKLKWLLSLIRSYRRVQNVEPIIVSQFFIEKYGIETLLITGLVTSDGNEVDGQERFFWTSMASDMMYELSEELILRLKTSEK